MQDTNDNRLAHLNMIQEIIKRLASNSFLVKGWSITLVSAIVALAIANRNVEITYLVMAPAVIFWGLDAYWLRQERLFRALYDYVRTEAPGSIDGQVFSMDTRHVSKNVRKLLPTMLNPTIFAIHGLIVAASVTVSIIATNCTVSGG